MNIGRKRISTVLKQCKPNLLTKTNVEGVSDE